jgi:hypothetical protein
MMVAGRRNSKGQESQAHVAAGRREKLRTGCQMGTVSATELHRTR